jgi:hypothetical protein
MIYEITYSKTFKQTVSTHDLDHAARIACQTVLGAPKDTIKVLSILPQYPPSLPPATIAGGVAEMTYPGEVEITLPEIA